MNKSLSRLPQGFLAQYYREQPDSVKENIRKALGICSSLNVQVPDNQRVTHCEEKGSYHFTNPISK